MKNKYTVTIDIEKELILIFKDDVEAQFAMALTGEQTKTLIKLLSDGITALKTKPWTKIQ